MKLTHTRLLTFIFALLFAMTHCAWATDATLSGTIRDPFGNAFTGQIVMTLSQPAVDPTGVVDYIPLQVPFTVLNGALQSGAKLVSNDSLQPRNTYYLAQYFDPTGAMTVQKVFYFTAGPNNLGSMVPTNITTNNVSYLSPVSLSADNTWTGNNTFTKKIISTVPNGTPPLQLASSTKVSLLTSAALITDAANPPTTGLVRLGPTESVCWGTTASGDKCMKSTNGSAEYTLGFNGVDYPVGVSHYDNAVNTGIPLTVSNTVAETTFSTTDTIPANNLGPAAKTVVVRLHANGGLQNVSGGNITYTIRWRQDSLVGAVLCSNAGTIVASSGTFVPWHLDCQINYITAGAGGTSDAWGQYAVGATTGDIVNAVLLAADTTVAHQYVLTVQMSVANINGDIRLRNVTMERIGRQP